MPDQNRIQHVARRLYAKFYKDSMAHREGATPEEMWDSEPEKSWWLSLAIDAIEAAVEPIDQTPTETYTCVRCGGEFIKGWSDEEARADMAATLGKPPAGEPIAVICDPCYQDFTRWRDALTDEQKAEILKHAGLKEP